MCKVRCLVLAGKKDGCILNCRCRLWAVETPPTADCPGWCPHQPATILNAPKKILILNPTFKCSRKAEIDKRKLEILTVTVLKAIQ